jgi:hypothetical protein
MLHNPGCHLAAGSVGRAQEQDPDFLIFWHGHLNLIME